MRLGTILLRNLSHFRRQHLGVALGSALCAMVLIGALTVGDSVRATLSNLAEERIGKGDLAMLSPDGFFREDLADRVYEELSEPKAVVAPIALSRGTLTTPDGSVRVSKVQVLGVDERFWKLAPDPAKTPIGFGAQTDLLPEWESGSFFVNQRLGKRLNLQKGDRLILRMEEPSLFSRDAPLSGERDNRFITMNQGFGAVLPGEGFGNFGLQGNQREPLTLFVPLSSLQKKLFRSLDEASGNTQFANFLLLGTSGDGEIERENAQSALDKRWTLEDAGIEIMELRESKEWSVRTRQVFLSGGLVEQARMAARESTGVLTYLVNAIESVHDANRSALIPYSMMSAVEPHRVDFLGEDWQDDHIALNEWAANELNASLGDAVKVSFYTVGERRRLNESSRIFELRKILSMPNPVPEDLESDWTPRFPGLSDAESCGEWDTGIPIVHKVRDRDEDYWNEYRGSPKGFVSLKAGQEMWGNLWGSLTGIRISREDVTKEQLSIQLRKNLKAEDAGLVLRPLRSDARDSVESPVDFGELFLYFSSFVILAAMALTGMLFAFSMEQRNQQAGLLLGVGWSVRKARILFWGEGLVIAMLGSGVGALLAVLYGKGILELLAGKWSGAVSGASFAYEPSVSSILIGFFAAVSMALLAMIWATRKQCAKEPRELLSDARREEGASSRSSAAASKTLLVSLILFSAAFTLVSITDLSGGGASASFFGAGFLLLISGLLFFRAALSRLDRAPSPLIRAVDLAKRGVGRRAGRSLVTVGAMAAGAFLVVSTGAFRKQTPKSVGEPGSGTGGFAFLGETASPLYDDLNGMEGQTLYDLNRSLLKQAKVVPLRVRDGDDASCLNLNKAIRPRLYGVKVSEFEGRFSFAEGNWTSLRESENGVIPALVDQNTMMWALKKGVGDRMQFLDGQGQPFEVELRAVVKGSILQGALYLDESFFLERFPQQGGYRFFFLEGGEEVSEQAARELESKLSNYGLDFRPTSERLEELNRVENTYLSIFQGLGGLGLLLGTAGLAVVVARNLMERGREYALMEALGFELSTLRSLALKEHLQLAVWGVGIGSVSAVVGIAPALLGSAGELPGKEFIWFFLLLLGLGIFWTWLSVSLNLRTSRLKLLNEE